MKSAKFDIYGMTCASCANHIENAVKNLEGIEEVSVNLLTNTMNVIFDEKKIQCDLICDEVSKVGYKANESKALNESIFNNSDMRKRIIRLIISFAFLFFLMYVSMGHIMWNWPIPQFMNDPAILGIYECFITIVIMVINYRFFTSGIKSLIHLKPNMDTLVSIGSLASFFYSFVLLIMCIIFSLDGNVASSHNALHNMYFESAAMILTLISLGKTLEAFSKGKATNAIKELMDLSPKKINILSNGIEQNIDISEVQVNDIFIVRPGEVIPVDGMIIEGTTSIDESNITGESILVDKAINDAVIGGTINQIGFIKCIATRVGPDTTLNQIISLIEETNSTKAPIAKLSDRISNYFVPIILLISLITFIVWMILSKDIKEALNYATCVLVISCPCALGLATPVAIMVGSQVGAKNGILFKSAVALEETSKVDIVLLDKTGTITEGNPEVKEIITFNDHTEKELFFYMASLENKSEHPLARAIVTYAFTKKYDLCEAIDFKVHIGNGVSGTINGQEVHIGNKSFISSICSLSEHEEIIDRLSSSGVTVLLASLNKELIGIVTLEDKIKENSKEAIEKIKGLGIEVIMLTGDNKAVADKIASKVSLENKVIGNVLPNEKEEVVRRLQEKGKVLMVGDGVNDAPSLTRSDIGIAIGKGSDIAKNASEVVLMKSDLLGVYKAINLSSRVLLNIKENLFWAFIYNIICIPLAFGAFSAFNIKLTPMIGALAMSFSSVFVVLNALRLNLVNININHRKRKIMVNIETNEIKLERLSMQNIDIKIEGMMCEHCAMRVKKAIEENEEITSVNVVLGSKIASVVGYNIDKEKVKSSIEKVGYKVIDFEEIK